MWQRVKPTSLPPLQILSRNTNSCSDGQLLFSESWELVRWFGNNIVCMPPTALGWVILTGNQSYLRGLPLLHRGICVLTDL